MQLNNLVIIPIPYSVFDNFQYKEPLSPSPTKNFSRNISLRDQIPWKKSHSAFKKFKGKKDKENKSSKNSQTNIQLFQADKQQEILNKNFSLVDNDINFSLLNSQNNQVFKTQQTFDYFDPNAAPFFQYGISYQYLPKQGRVHVIEDQLESPHLLRKTESLKLKRQVSKKEKIIQENHSKQNLIKLQNVQSFEPPKSTSCEFFSDPFIIIKSSERRGQFLQSIIRNQNLKKEQYKKNKIIKKAIKSHSKPSSIRSYSNYSNQNSDQINKQKSSMSDDKSDDYGCDQLPIIQFDLCGHINSSACQQQKNQQIANLPVYQVKDDSQLYSRVRTFQKTTQVLNQYDFDHSKLSQKESVQKDRKRSSSLQNQRNNFQRQVLQKQ